MISDAPSEVTQEVHPYVVIIIIIFTVGIYSRGRFTN